MPALTENLRLGCDDGTDDGVRMGASGAPVRQLDRPRQVRAIRLGQREGAHRCSLQDRTFAQGPVVRWYTCTTGPGRS